MSSVDNLEEVDWLLEESEPEVSAATRKLRMLRTLRCGNKYERAARAQGATIIAGVDEVGRGALFGPVVAAAVILPPDCRIRGLRDSKQLLPPTANASPQSSRRKQSPSPSKRSASRSSTG